MLTTEEGCARSESERSILATPMSKQLLAAQ